jgi:predicted dienelactone hydrolase
MYLVEDLVSHGYIVVGVDHTGNSGPTAFPDGHVSQPLDDPRMNFFTYTYPQVNVYGARQQAIQVDDDRFVLDELERWNQQPSSRYYRRLDMDRVAALGHSFGGSVSAEDCLDDPRFKAALDLDGSFWGPVQKAGMTRPLMMIEEEYDVYTPDELKNNPGAKVDYLFDLSDDAMMARSNGYRIVIHGSTHSSYTDRSLFSPFKQYSGEGRVPKMREYAMIRSYALAFFDKTLRGVASPLLDPSRQAFPEATLTVLHWPAS